MNKLDLILEIYTYTVILTTVSALNHENVFTDSTCQTIEDCKKFDPLNYIDSLNCIEVDGSSKRCLCKESDSYHMQNGSCQFLPGIGEHCLKETRRCLKKHSSCTDSSDGLHKCMCDQNTLHVRKNGEEYCAQMITTFLDVNCFICENNEGKCYDINDDLLKDGCLCPASRSGENCEIIHVDVKCWVDTMTMNVCYFQHDGINLSTSSRIYTNNHGEDIKCQGRPNEKYCKYKGAYLLQLPLKEDHCGMRKIMMTDSIKYSSKIYVQKYDMPSVNDIIFDTFCEFITQVRSNFQAVGVIEHARGSVGVHSVPNLSTFIENTIGERVPSDTYMRVGDSVRFIIVLNKRDAYGAIKVRNCIASNSYTLGDDDSLSLPLIAEGCPVANQNTFNSLNNWRRYSSQAHMLETGKIKLFKFSSGSNFFLHCRVILCLMNEMNKCNPSVCSNSTLLKSSKRQRRATDQFAEDNVVMSIRFSSEKELESVQDIPSDDNYVKLNRQTFVSVITILSILIFLLLASSIGFLYLYRREVIRRDDTACLFRKSQTAQLKLREYDNEAAEKEDEAYI
ncbi:DgyrCDS12325 [Dimorphilus gyrociliatus]|uniref:DgyrCDS12325 n=1 Tax=Dimorphilus gyrociliatus TaxID=2664684 RepID=A0A7I8W8J3_9ANNE|nr:DgyrCDS12325 [Dimorphilus gyrociliatus]